MTYQRHLVALGGCGGLGRDLTARAVQDGWRVTVLDLPASLAAHPPPGERRAIDLRDPASVTAAFDGLGAIDGFVNLSGFMSPNAPLETTDIDTFDEVLSGNFRGAFLAAQAAAPLLRLGRTPAMVTVVSGLAAAVRAGFGPYGAAKAAMVHMTKTLALELAPDIRVNAVAPAAVDTAFLRGGTGRAKQDNTLNLNAYTASIPLGRLAEPPDITGPILFLLGPDSAFMTGQTLWINGGGYMP
ncbi:SDR family NAD(P)-dependent oxidoreductase [Oceaniglobus ichthyenteri]|uniref:SDR family NAD(P)-dependent oxidoreductase n=1 Tax=Oceaniglobus ichthyenteri TaxID=2136177 RepID=UPI000D3A8ADF|nr:SDR family oxidoreductase [Oceaniglobus ichthyenteri]